MTAVYGIVLAGGGARRLGGVDKAMLEVGGRTMIDRVLAALAGAGVAPLIVVGPPRPVGVDGVVFTEEAVGGGGPVPAVAAGLARLAELCPALPGSPADDSIVVVLPVDVPWVTSVDIASLVAALQAGPDLEAVACPDQRGRPNPLVAAYRTTALSGAGSAGDPASVLLPRAHAIVATGGGADINVNTPRDLERARRRATRSGS